jgi:hypothetical protein
MNTCQVFRGPSPCMPISVLLDATVSAEPCCSIVCYWLAGPKGLCLYASMTDLIGTEDTPVQSSHAWML